MPVREVIQNARERMQKALEALQEELKSVRAGRASTLLVESLKVDYYDSPTPLKQIASLAAPSPEMIVIKPFDPGAVKQIESAIKNSDLSIAPIIDGKLIRLNIPPLSEERRSQLVTQTKQAGEQAKVAIRNIRRDTNKHIEQQQKEKLITEDELTGGHKNADELTREFTDKVDKLIKTKSDEIMLD